jgi:hypothetical protein
LRRSQNVIEKKRSYRASLSQWGKKGRISKELWHGRQISLQFSEPWRIIVGFVW